MRIPVLMARGPGKGAPLEPGPETEPGLAAYLLEGEGVAPDGGYAVRFALPAMRHFIGCACCAPRGPAAAALSAMFRARATGEAPFFEKVITCASPAGVTAVRGALADDAVAAARFRYALE